MTPSELHMTCGVYWKDNP